MVINYFKNIKTYPFLIGGIVAIIFFQAITYLTLYLLEIEITYFQTYKAFFEGQSVIYSIPIICLFGPALETMIFQVIPIDYFQKQSSSISAISAILFSTILFSAAHIFNGSFYPLMVFPGGIVLALTYLKFREDYKGFLFTALQHAVYNLGLLIFLKV